jgi:hypothetical protein
MVSVNTRLSSAPRSRAVLLLRDTWVHSPQHSPRVSEKLDLMGWALFRDQVLPALPREIQANIDEEEYLATKIRLLESLGRCLSKHPGGGE